jgi:hypothetical protein
MRAEVIVFPDTEALLVDHLKAELGARGRADVVVAVTMPAHRPTRCVLVPRVGGARRGLVVDAATIGVECWGASETDAHDLAQLVRGLLAALPGRLLDGTPVYRVEELGGPTNLPDPVSGQARYTLTAAVHVRGRALPAAGPGGTAPNHN